MTKVFADSSDVIWINDQVKHITANGTEISQEIFMRKPIQLKLAEDILHQRDFLPRLSLSGSAGILLFGVGAKVALDTARQVFELNVKGTAFGIGFDTNIEIDLVTGEVLNHSTDIGVQLILGAKGEVQGVAIGFEGTQKWGVTFDGDELFLNDSLNLEMGLLADIVSADSYRIQIGENPFVGKTIHQQGIVIEPDGTQRSASEFDEQEVNRVFESFDIFGRPCFVAGTPIKNEHGVETSIELVKVGDRVLAFDENDRDGLADLNSDRVSHTRVTPNKTVIDFHGTQATPDHVFLTEGGEFMQLTDILEADGIVVREDGGKRRARTG